MLRFFSTISLLFFIYSVTAQIETKDEITNPSVLEMHIDYGFLINHSSSLRELGNSNPYALGVDWGKMLLSPKAWEFCSCFPKLGVSLTYWNWDNPDALGHGLLAIAYAEPHFGTQNRLNYFFRMGLGAAYMTHPYDVEENPLNLSYSTRLNFPLLVGAGVNYRLSNSWNLRLLAKYNHLSNGGISSPNKGLNFPTLSLGVSKSLAPINFPDFNQNGKREAPEDKARLSFTHFSGWSNATVGGKDKFYVLGFAFNYSRWMVGRSALTGGTEWVYDYSRREQIALEGRDDSFLKAAVLLGHEFWLGRVTFGQQLGVYYFNKYRINDDVYQRYVLTYDFSKRIFGGISLKAHRHVADFFDFRVGYRFY
ncbi:acyloxyacyl hydrolase [Aureisphaera sp. CAU 1614]|uniref:Acyloxyacyl hydrolase n=1 Tax=Halomarinibacterium sedimenti TaxID=2857106 RepID=A0A9X1FPN6_9FLAO|nr:acyloxyacyl hydrolase [Halomarinibacterium sedimenti]MBW2938503.1 acyloxyacyl hydrolase [Halomarinibacterium sedimenti]